MSGLTVKRDLYPEQNNKNVKISIPVINPEIYQMPRRTKRSSILGRLTVLCGKALLIRQDRVVVGRNSDNSQTHFQVGDCSAISIRHFTLYFEKPSFWSLMVHSENGLLVDDVLLCSSIKLFHIQNKRCWIRFPGTSIVVLFENFTIDGE